MSIGCLKNKCMTELKEKYMKDEKKEAKIKAMTIDQAFIIYKIKLQTYLEMMKELKEIEDGPECYDEAYENVRPLMIDVLH